MSGLAKAVTEAVLTADATPHVLTRDAARGVVEWCFRNGLVGERALEQARPPYGSKPPKTPRSREWLEQSYERHSYDDRRPGFGSIFRSVFEDDFGIYVVPRVNRFSLYRLGEQRPEPKEPSEPTVRWNRFDKQSSQMSPTLINDVVIDARFLSQRQEDGSR